MTLLARPRAALIWTLLACWCKTVIGKSFEGVLTSQEAKRTWGQYLSSFCFYDSGGEVQFNTNVTGQTAQLLLYAQEDWELAQNAVTCHSRLQHVTVTVAISNTTGSHKLQAQTRPDIWHAVYTDSLTCNLDDTQVKDLKEDSEKEKEITDNYIYLHLELLNPDSLGNPTNHFGVDETGNMEQPFTRGRFFVYADVADSVRCRLNNKSTLDQSFMFADNQGQANTHTRHSTNAVSMLGQRRRRWPIIEKLTAPAIFIVFVGYMASGSGYPEGGGLFRFYQLLVLAYFVLACIYTPTLLEALNKQGPMHLVLQLLTGAMLMQAFGLLLTVLHLRSYSKDGFGAPIFELLSELLDLVSQFVMLLMMLSLCLGFTLAGTHKPARSLHKLREKPLTKLVVVIAILQGGLFIWEQWEERRYRRYHAHRSSAGMALALARVVLAAILAHNVNNTISMERSAFKREFYSSFTKCCLLWFLSQPVLLLLSYLVIDYLRFKIVVIGVVLCQTVAVVLLYRLFLSRSLYWEVSALSSTLPLHMDFGSKLYS